MLTTDVSLAFRSLYNRYVPSIDITPTHILTSRENEDTTELIETS